MKRAVLSMAFAVLATLPCVPPAAQESPGERARSLVGGAGYQDELPGLSSGGQGARNDLPAGESGEVPPESTSADPGPGGPVDPGPGPTVSQMAVAGGVATVLQAFLWFVVIAALIFVILAVGGAVARRRATVSVGIGAVAPSPVPPRALPSLAEVDGLAARGEHAAAVHLLLLHALRIFAERSGGRLAPSLTSREVVRGAKGRDRELLERLVIAVEKSLFGGRALGRPDYDACRATFDLFAGSEPA